MSDSKEGAKRSVYHREVPTTCPKCGAAHMATIDVYAVLHAFRVIHQALAHAIKKLLLPGQRSGGKSEAQDIAEAIWSCQRWQQMQAQEAAALETELAASPPTPAGMEPGQVYRTDGAAPAMTTGQAACPRCDHPRHAGSICAHGAGPGRSECRCWATAQELAEADASAAVPVTPTCEPWCGTSEYGRPTHWRRDREQVYWCSEACLDARRPLNRAAVPPAVPGEPPETEQSTWELVTAPLDCEEDEDEYNPRGFWLGNKETNRVFILPGDMGVVRRLLLGADAHASRPLAVATELLRRTHMCATARPDGTCDGCDIGDFLAGAASPAPGSVSLLSERVLAAKCPACRARIGKPCWTWSDDDEPTVCLARLRTAEASTPPTLVGPGIRDAVLEEAAMAADGPACARQCRHDDCKAFRIVASRIRALKSTQTSEAGK